MNRLRHIIHDQDLDKFDELIYKREEQAMLKSKTAPESLKFKQFLANKDSSESSFECPENETNNDNNDENDENQVVKSPTQRYLPVPQERDEQHSEDSGVEINNTSFTRNSRYLFFFILLITSYHSRKPIPINTFLFTNHRLRLLSTYR